jgi:hypothetical protein
MITYTKTINSLDSYKDIDGNTDVVFNIYWNLIGEENGVSTSCPAITTVPYVAGSSFIPFADLTEEIVLGWINTYTTLAAMQQYENTVSFAIQQQSQQESPPLPWNPQPVPVTNPMV